MSIGESVVNELTNELFVLFVLLFFDMKSEGHNSEDVFVMKSVILSKHIKHGFFIAK